MATTKKMESHVVSFVGDMLVPWRVMNIMKLGRCLSCSSWDFEAFKSCHTKTENVDSHVLYLKGCFLVKHDETQTYCENSKLRFMLELFFSSGESTQTFRLNRTRKVREAYNQDMEVCVCVNC